MNGHDIIVVGASAGGVEALTRLVKNLPSDLPASIFIVLHISPDGTSVLPQILNRCKSLKACHPKDGEAIEQGQIYIAPPDYHLLVKRDYIRLARGPRENGHRPAVDALFRTAARAYGARVVGVVLSGTLDDGTAGLLAIKHQGGVAIVQDPEDAMFSGMPRSAIENVKNIDQILPLNNIPAALVEWVHKLVDEGEKPVSDEMEVETDMAELDKAALQNTHRPGKPSGYGCPDCGGVLWEIQEREIIRFRCRIGHAWSADSLLAKQSDALEEALWIALRALEESAALSLRLAERASDRQQQWLADRFEREVQESKQRAAVIREVLLQGEEINPIDNGEKFANEYESNQR